jgi:hypothetical protein
LNAALRSFSRSQSSQRNSTGSARKMTRSYVGGRASKDATATSDSDAMLLQQRSRRRRVRGHGRGNAGGGRTSLHVHVSAKPRSAARVPGAAAREQRPHPSRRGGLF